MGRLYQKTASGERILACFESGQVQSERRDNIEVCYDSSGQIYYDNPAKKRCVIAICEQREISSRELKVAV